LIACTALAHDAVLVTDDQALQQCNIPGLAIENWLVH
jgi:predicted nucleic acid-binding protein